MKISVWSLGCQQSVFQRYHSEIHLSEFYPQDGDESQLASKVRHCHPMYITREVLRYWELTGGRVGVWSVTWSRLFRCFPVRSSLASRWVSRLESDSVRRHIDCCRRRRAMMTCSQWRARVNASLDQSPSDPVRSGFNQSGRLKRDPVLTNI